MLEEGRLCECPAELALEIHPVIHCVPYPLGDDDLRCLKPFQQPVGPIRAQAQLPGYAIDAGPLPDMPHKEVHGPRFVHGHAMHGVYTLDV